MKYYEYKGRYFLESKPHLTQPSVAHKRARPITVFNPLMKTDPVPAVQTAQINVFFELHKPIVIAKLMKATFT